MRSNLQTYDEYKTSYLCYQPILIMPQHLQAEEHHPNREALGWQHHVVPTTGRTGALHKIDGIMMLENDVDILKHHLKTSVNVKAWSQMGLPNGQ